MECFESNSSSTEGQHRPVTVFLTLNAHHDALERKLRLRRVCSGGQLVNYPEEIVKNNSNKGEAVGGSDNALPDLPHKSS